MSLLKLISILDDKNSFDFISSGKWAPPTDIYEDEKYFYIEMELAGMEENNIEIDLTDNVMNISGNRINPKGASNISYHQMEIIQGTFSRTIVFPFSLSQEKVNAEYQKGMLMIKIEKSQSIKKGIKIEVK